MRSCSHAGSNHLCERHGSPDRKVGEVHYKNVRYLGIFNPRLNTVYRYEVNRLPEETIEFVDYDIIVYPPEI